MTDSPKDITALEDSYRGTSGNDDRAYMAQVERTGNTFCLALDSNMKVNGAIREWAAITIQVVIERIKAEVTDNAAR